MQKTQLNCLEQDNNYNNNNNMIDDNQLGDVVCTKSSQTTNATHGSSPMNSTTKIPGMLNDDASLLSSTGSKLHSSSRPIMGLNRSVQMKSIGHNNNNVLYPITSMNQVPATASIQQNNHLLNQMTLNETINKDYNTTNLLPKQIRLKIPGEDAKTSQDWFGRNKTDVHYSEIGTVEIFQYPTRR
ncbi:unnamed protein product [Trichobilharzia regenti]|nr:unnamed protein product [Trichobilharzia regenti]